MSEHRPRGAVQRGSVSVVIPNYNYAHFLEETAKSALAQTDVDVDVVIIDNASTDGSRDVAERLMAADDRVRCIFRTSNQGHIANFNEGLSNATGEYVTLLCADDLLTPGSLSRSTALLSARHEVAFVYGSARRFTDEKPAPRTQVRSWSTWTGPEWLDRVCRRGYTGILSPEVVIRRSVMTHLAYDATNGHAADFKVWLGATRHGGVGRINGPDQAFFRVHGANLHKNEYSGRLFDLRARARAFEAFFAEGDETPDVDHDLWRRALSAEALDQASRSYDRGRVVSQEIDGLEEFALEVYAGATDSREWQALRRRKRVGPRFAQYVPAYFAAAVRRRLREEITRRHMAGSVV